MSHSSLVKPRALEQEMKAMEKEKKGIKDTISMSLIPLNGEELESETPK